MRRGETRRECHRSRTEQKSYIRAYAKHKELFFAIEMNVNTTNRTMKAVFMLATVHPFLSQPPPPNPSVGRPTAIHDLSCASSSPPRFSFCIRNRIEML